MCHKRAHKWMLSVSSQAWVRSINAEVSAVAQVGEHPQNIWKIKLIEDDYGSLKLKFFSGYFRYLQRLHFVDPRPRPIRVASTL